MKFAHRRPVEFFFASLDTDLRGHLAYLSLNSAERRAVRRKSTVSEIKDAIRKSEIEIQADILEAYKPDPDAKLDLVFERAGRAFAYYHFDRGPRRYWQRYRVDGGRPVVDAVFPVAIRNAQ